MSQLISSDAPLSSMDCSVLRFEIRDALERIGRIGERAWAQRVQSAAMHGRDSAACTICGRRAAVLVAIGVVAGETDVQRCRRA